MKSFILNIFPHATENMFLGLYQIEWLLLIGVFFGCLIFEFCGRRIFELILYFLTKKKLNMKTRELVKYSRPVGLLLFSLSWLASIKTNILQERISFFAQLFGQIILSISLVYLAHVIINILGRHFTEKTKETDTKFDDIMVPLIRKTALVAVYAFGSVNILSAMSVDVKGLVAGIGIGGLALAFAAKDTLANLFGSIMLVLDRPFDVGDFIVTGDIEGIVEDVGFRSTRIRTFYDSIITISNGQLINQPIDNRGKRRYRRFTTDLGVQYDTPPEKIELFCEGIRKLIQNHKWTRKDYFNVYFSGFNASSLDIRLQVFWETEDYTREMNERHRLLIDILRLSKKLKIDFAFPTRTLHMFSESKIEDSSDLENLEPEKLLEEGENVAETLVKSPITSQSPRSTVDDLKEKNIGL